MISDRSVDSSPLNAKDASDVRKDAGWIRLDRLKTLSVKGPQRVKFLHNLLSNDVANLETGRSRLAALMNVKGQQLAWMNVLAGADALVCELPAAVRDLTHDAFVHYKVGAPVRFEKNETVVFGVFGERGEALLHGLGLGVDAPLVGSFTAARLSDIELIVSRAADMPAGGFTVHVASSDALGLETAVRGELGDPIAAEMLDALRIEDGIPWHGIDVTDENLLHETGQLSLYHSPSKGCYIGQEVIARLEGRGGNVNKKLRGLRSTRALRPGEEITFDGKAVGRVTSAARSRESGFIAMGYVHRSQSESGTIVTIGGDGATVAALPLRT